MGLRFARCELRYYLIWLVSDTVDTGDQLELQRGKGVLLPLYETYKTLKNNSCTSTAATTITTAATTITTAATTTTTTAATTTTTTITTTTTTNNNKNNNYCVDWMGLFWLNAHRNFHGIDVFWSSRCSEVYL